VVFVRSLINPHSPAGRLVFEHVDEYKLFLSRPLLEEIFEALNRPELTAKYRTREVNYPRIFQLLEQAPVVQVGEIPLVVRDPKDDMVVATAVAAHAGYIVSEDHDLLDLDLSESHGFRVINVATFLNLLLRPE